VTNSATGALSGAASLSSVGAIASNLSTGALNGISSATASLGSAASLLTGSSLTGAGSALNGAVGSALAGVTGAATKALGGITGAAGAALGKIDSLTKGLQSGKVGLASLASAGLPAGAAAALSASINALSSSSPFPIKMPSIATGTIDRSEITALASKLLGNPIIPAANFTDPVTAAAKAAADSSSAKLEAYDKIHAEGEVERAKYTKLMNEAIVAFETAKNTLPAGDPEIESLRKAARAAIMKSSDVSIEWYRKEQIALGFKPAI
jgi:hypothetical protein